MKKNKLFSWRETLWAIIAIEASILLVILIVDQRQMYAEQQRLEAQIEHLTGMYTYDHMSLNAVSVPAPTTNTQSTKHIETPTATSDDLGTWETYRDETAGYEVQYPKGYVVYKYRNTGNCTFVRDDVNGKNIIFWNKSYLQSKESTSTQIADFDIRVNDPDDACVRNAYVSAKGRILRPDLIQTNHFISSELDKLKRYYVHLLPNGATTTSYFSTYRFKKNGVYYTLQAKNGIPYLYGDGDSLFFDHFVNSFKFFDKN